MFEHLLHVSTHYVILYDERKSNTLYNLRV